MADAGDNNTSVAATRVPSQERVLLAAALAAVFADFLGVGATAILLRVTGTSPAGSSPFVAAGSAAIVLALMPWARRGGGPLLAIARRLPDELDGGLHRRPVAARLAGALALLAVVQVARLSCFMADPALRWASAFPPVDFGVRHMCLSAYVHAADLARSGVANVYAEEYYPAYYPGGADQAPPVPSPVANLSPHIRDAFEYPPPFLLLPRAALLLRNDFHYPALDVRSDRDTHPGFLGHAPIRRRETGAAPRGGRPPAASAHQFDRTGRALLTTGLTKGTSPAAPARLRYSP